jgi:hypothetical protein
MKPQTHQITAISVAVLVGAVNTWMADSSNSSQIISTQYSQTAGTFVCFILYVPPV